MRREHGFALTELLVAMTLMLIVLFATLQTLDVFASGKSSSDRLTAAQDQARSRIDQLVVILRNATPGGAYAVPVVRAAPNDLVVSTTDWPGEGSRTGNPHTIRYCLDTSGTGILWFDGLYNPSGPNANPGAPCPSQQAGWQHQAIIAQGVANSATKPLFSYNSADPAAVRAIGIDLYIGYGTAQARKTTHLQSGTFLRSRAELAPAVTASDLTSACDPANAGSALLKLAVAFDANGDPLKVSYTENGVSIGSGAILLASGSYTISATVTNVLGLSTLLTKTLTVSCP